MSWPSTVTRPSLGFTIPQTMLMSVVLPAPFGPSSAKISPRRISRLTFFSALKPEAYVLDRFATEMMDCMACVVILLPRTGKLAQGERGLGACRLDPPQLRQQRAGGRRVDR